MGSVWYHSHGVSAIISAVACLAGTPQVAERLRVANPRRHASAIISHAMVLAVAGQYWKAEKLVGSAVHIYTCNVSAVWHRLCGSA